MAKFYSTKTYGNDRGLSCCFRQWRATHSHCSTLHGYSIGIKLIFECDTLDDKNWCMDFGGLKEFKAWADEMFDHTLVIAKDDPHLPFFQQMANMGNIPSSGNGNQEFDKLKPYQRGALCN
jgi:6-pyruvoyltetrahydropterin/6-carboxytetrahydropterin synthase